MTVQRRVGVAVVAILALTASGCGGDDSGAATETRVTADPGSPTTGDDAATGDAPADDAPADDDDGGDTPPDDTSSDNAPTGGDQPDDAGPGPIAGVTDCGDVPQSVLDQVAPGLEPSELAVESPITEVACIWESDAFLLQLTAFEGQQFWPEALYEDDEEIEMIPVTLCDRAFVVEVFGLDLNVLDGDTVWTVGASQAGTPRDERLSRDEGIDRLVTFARAVIDC